MNTVQVSLRLLVEKWFGPGTSAHLPMIRFTRARLHGTRCVRVDALRTKDSIEIFFFQHQDGEWRVFPPETKRLEMSINVWQ
ncbi:hypothetical protein [Caballeronia udeis]|uniref:hypothetical protein n=1 Tax=Caballeronia udeis TaxID=1232866 RepID=UPI00094FA328|nr:hypothetical protein [Caballeronia udeis]